MKYWADLFPPVDQDMVRAGVGVMLKISTLILKRNYALQGPRLLLNGGSTKDEVTTELKEDQQTPPGQDEQT
jgi:hypothetical protein